MNHPTSARRASQTEQYRPTDTQECARPLPVPTPTASPGAALPVLSEVAQLDSTLIELSRAVRRRDTDTLRVAVESIDDLRARWRRVDRPATVDEIRVAVLRLTTTMPVAGNISMNVLAEALCDDLAEVRPSKFVLERAVAKHRQRSEFLSATKLLEEIKRAQDRASRFRYILDNEDVPRLIRRGEARQKAAIEATARWEAKEAERKRRLEAELRAHAALLRRLGGNKQEAEGNR